MEKKKVFISRNYKNPCSAGSKARIDTECLLEEWGWTNIGVKRSSHQNKAQDFLINIIGISKALIFMPRHGVIFLQYPIKKYFSIICTIASWKKIEVITLIHDLGTFRRKKITIEKELSRLNKVNHIIATNKAMQDWLIKHGEKPTVGALGAWHYLTETKKEISLSLTENYPSKKVYYIGSISNRKNSFISSFIKMRRGYEVIVYGGNLDIKASMFESMNFVHYSKIIKDISPGFGLIWDGDNIDLCSGSFGEYLAYNTPHKMSLYIQCHLPLIVWDKSAMASFVTEHKIGITITSLTEIDRYLATMSSNEYYEMKKNVMELGEEISRGTFLQKALQESKLL